MGDRGLGTKSHSGFIATLNGVPVHWRSRKQPKTVLSPAHAEIYALSEGVREAQLFQWICRDMRVNLPVPITVNVDNSQCIAFVNSTCINSKLRGMIDTRESWVKEVKDDKLVAVQHVRSNCNYADVLSKCIPGYQFNNLVRLIMQGCKKRSQVKDFEKIKAKTLGGKRVS